ncbi:MAG TPA: hypothetical protein VER03_21790 [Bryobacteraceae bacterium]|nr:hypothetical protein [Bryobacteraceae bacterium]
MDKLVDKEQPRARSAVHLVFIGEKFRPEYFELVPASRPVQTRDGVLLAPRCPI